VRAVPLRSRLRRALESLAGDGGAAGERELRKIRQEQRRQLELLLRTQRAVDALVRAAYVEHETLDFPQRLTVRRFGLLSQNSEDGIVLELLREGVQSSRRFVEIGCGGNGGNSGFLATELGFSGVMLDGSSDAVAESRLRFNSERVTVAAARVTRENVDELLTGHGITGEIDVLSIDIDGNEIWIWERLSACSPRLVIVEYNAFFGPSRAVAVPYDPAFSHDGSAYFGASLAAFVRMGARKGYRLVAVEQRGANAFFLRDDVAPQIPGCSSESVYAPLLATRNLYTAIGGEKARRLVEQQESLLAREPELVEVD
jgi:hypothetical protein